MLFCNAPARGLFASLREGSHISSVIRTPEFLDAVSAAPERGRAVTVTYAERVPVGRRMAATVAPLARGSERGGNILVLLRDLTEGERINQMRADFIANASHELRTPLASLRGFIETLQGSAKGDHGRAGALPADHGRAGLAHDAADRCAAVVEPGRDERACAAVRPRRSQRRAE